LIPDRVELKAERVKGKMYKLTYTEEVNLPPEDFEVVMATTSLGLKLTGVPYKIEGNTLSIEATVPAEVLTAALIYEFLGWITTTFVTSEEYLKLKDQIDIKQLHKLTQSFLENLKKLREEEAKRLNDAGKT
jgi:hypothetical protein